MSWQAYVDTSLIGSGHLENGSIISAAGDSVWATSANFQIKPEEMKSLVTILSGDKSTIDKTYADGLYVGGTRYVLTKIDGGSLYARHDKDGIVATKTKQAILVGRHNATQQAGSAMQTVAALGEYLIKLEY